MKINRSCSSFAVLAGSVAALSLFASSAQAYTMTPDVNKNGKTIGNIINVDSEYDTGRTLDPTKWSAKAGQRQTIDGRRETLTQNLQAETTFKIGAITANELRLDVRIDNNTAIKQGYDALITNLRFKVAQADDAWQNVWFNDGNNYTLDAGDFQEFTMVISGDFTKTNGMPGFEADISRIKTDWWAGTDDHQTGGDYRLKGTPEPITMLGTALAGGFGIAMKRKSGKNKNQQKEKAAA